MKRLDQAKSRLAEILVPAARRALALEMLERVLTTIHDVRLGIDDGAAERRARITQSLIAAVWLVSPDPLVLALAEMYRARPLFDPTGNLNAALELARDTVRRAGAGGLLVIPGDMPLITPQDVGELANQLNAGADVVIAPDAEGNGTNALGVRLPSPLRFQFGVNSFTHHIRAACLQGLRIQIARSPTLALDVDTAEVYERYREYMLRR